MLQFFATVWEVFWRALALDEQLLVVAQSAPRGAADLVVVTIVFLAGAAQLLGQSAVLFLNRVRPGRFLASLLLGGAVYLFGLLVWSVLIWLIGSAAGFSASFDLVARQVGLGTAPLIFSIFVLIPYAGPFIGRILSVWTLLVTVGMLRFTYGTDFFTALLIVGAGWLAVVLLNALVGRPIRRLRTQLFRRVADSELNATAQDLLRSIPTADGAAPGVSEGR